MAEMTTREAVEQALVEAGAAKVAKHSYTLGERFFTVINPHTIVTVKHEDVPALLRGASPSLTEEQRDALLEACEELTDILGNSTADSMARLKDAYDKAIAAIAEARGTTSKEGAS